MTPESIFSGGLRKSNLTDNESAKMATGKGVVPNDERAVGHARRLGGEDRMGETPTGEPKAGGDIRQLEIGQLT